MKEKEFGFGAIESPTDLRDYRLEVSGAQVFPETFELEMVRVKNQGLTSSCVAHAISEVVEYFNKKQKDSTTEMSIVYIYGNRRNSLHASQGMVVRDALSSALEYGDVSRARLSGNLEVPDAIDKFEESVDSLKELGMVNRFSTYFRLYKENEIKSALVNNGPVIFAMDWYTGYKVVDGILSFIDKGNKSGGHCMVIYGWNEKGWKVLNSWGKTWGDQGTFILPYDFKMTEAWGITDTITEDSDLDIKKPFSSILLDMIAKFLNKIINYFKNLKK